MVVELNPRFHPDGGRFLVKPYPKDKEWRQLRIADHLLEKFKDEVASRGLGTNDLMFELRQRTEPRRRVPAELPDPETLGWTEPNAMGRRYRHGTATAYVSALCRCRPCTDVMAVYRAARRAQGKDRPRTPRQVDTDGHVGRDWFRRNVWMKALAASGLGFHTTPHALRHAHASWLLAGGAHPRRAGDRRLAKATGATIDRIRTQLPAGSLVGGAAAENHDLEKVPSERTPLVFGLLIGLGFLLLLVALGSPLVAFVGVVTNLASIAGAFGMGKWIFQDGPCPGCSASRRGIRRRVGSTVLRRHGLGRRDGLHPVPGCQPPASTTT